MSLKFGSGTGFSLNRNTTGTATGTGTGLGATTSGFRLGGTTGGTGTTSTFGQKFGAATSATTGTGTGLGTGGGLKFGLGGGLSTGGTGFGSLARTTGLANPIGGAAVGAAAAGASGATSNDEVAVKLNQIKEAYNRASPQCRFQYVLYNKVQDRSLIERSSACPPHANPKVWSLGVANNPQPQELVPCLIVGFEDLEKRIEEQNKARMRYEETLALLNERIAVLHKQREEKTKPEAESILSKHLELSTRLNRLMTYIETQRSAEVPMNESEVDFKRKVEYLYRELNRPGEYRARVEDLSRLVQMLTERRVEMEKQSAGINGSSGLRNRNTSLLDETSARQLYSFLDSQRECVELMVREVAHVKQDIEVIDRELSGAGWR